jgi:hypothetical protein
MFKLSPGTDTELLLQNVATTGLKSGTATALQGSTFVFSFSLCLRLKKGTR